jgi:hypothetical protein
LVRELVDEFFQLRNVSLLSESRVLRVLSIAVSAGADEERRGETEITFVVIFLHLTFAFSFEIPCLFRRLQDTVGPPLQRQRHEVVFLV